MPLRCCLFVLLFTPVAVRAQGDALTLRVAHQGCDTTVALARMRTLPMRKASITSRDGVEAHYEGVRLKELLGLDRASIAAIDKHAMARSYVRVEAGDGYTAIIALTECDSTFREQPVLLAWKKDGVAMDDHEVPFKLIVPDDLRHAHDVRKVTRSEVVTP